MVIWASGDALVLGWLVGCVVIEDLPLGRRGSFLCGGFETRLVGFVGGVVVGAMLVCPGDVLCDCDVDVDVLRWWGWWCSCDRNERLACESLRQLRKSYRLQSLIPSPK